GEDIVLTASKGTYVSEDGLELRAITDGSVQRDRKGVLYVEEAYNIRGNLGYSTGNVNCAGDVKVGGDVLSGFSLIATGDVVINGVIEGAKVISKSGSVMVKGGIHGQQNQAYIEAKETVAARFVQEATIISGDTVMISGHILDSTIKAARIVDVSSKHGSVMNSLVQAAEEIIVRNLGGPGSKGTEARISDLETNATEIRENIQRLGRTIAALEDKVGRLKDVVDTLSKTGGRAIMKGSGIKNYVERIVKENDNLSKVMDERAELRKLLAKLLCGRITIIDTLYPGCKITIAGLSETINDPIRKLVYTVEKGELVARPYSPSS
ncbi:MAG: DUF342 domain-containing protein, partial [Candidatus Coatesbacteria bacterium]|nr:DUF342 domain-containing protein [Candidatus Coatesbacteria bacterium]